MTATLQKNNLVSMTLTSDDIKNAVKTFAMSKRYINKAVKISVINILYRRLNLSEDEFITKKFNNVPFKSCRPKSHHPRIKAYFTYMGGFKDALEMNYLRTMYLYFVHKTTNDIVEDYKFSFEYSRTSTAHERQEIVLNLTEATTEFLQSLSQLNSHAKLGDDIVVQVEFDYFEDTPGEYEPPGFESLRLENALTARLDDEEHSIAIGTLFTGFHRLQCRGRGSTEELLQNVVSIDDTPQAEKDNPKHDPKEQQEDEVYCISDDEDLDVPSAECDMCRLPYGGNLSDIDTIKCIKCGKTFHAACRGYLDRTYAKKPFYCCDSSADDDFPLDFKGYNRLQVSRVRFLVASIYKRGSISRGLASVFNSTISILKSTNFIRETSNNKLMPYQHALTQLFNFTHRPLMESQGL